MFLCICGCQNDVFLYFCISETLKPYGMKWLKPLFHVFQDLVITYPQKKNCVVPRWSQQQVPGVWLGHAALEKARHQFYLLIPCVQACGHSVFQTAFANHPAIPYVLQSNGNQTHFVFLLFEVTCILLPVCRQYSLGACCRVTVLWYHDDDVKFKPNRRNSIHLKENQTGVRMNDASICAYYFKKAGAIPNIWKRLKMLIF